MSKIDVSMVYKDRIEQIENDIKLAIKHKKWDKKWQLMKEKAKLELKIEEIEV